VGSQHGEIHISDRKGEGTMSKMTEDKGLILQIWLEIVPKNTQFLPERHLYVCISHKSNVKEVLNFG